MEQLYQSRYSGREIDRRLGLMAGNFLWIKWSNTFPVATMLDEPGPYIGVYAGESNDPPADPAEYKWYLNKGNDGSPGPKGDKGNVGEKGEPGDTGPQGEKGDTGHGLDILGTYSTLAALEAAVPSPTQGDMYNVGLAAPYNIYMWDAGLSDWLDQGVLQGPAGKDGADGQNGRDGADGQDGAPGPNQITEDTETPFTGLLMGNGEEVGVAVPGTHYAKAPITLTVTLLAANWTAAGAGYYQIVELVGMRSTLNIIVSPAPDDFYDYSAAQVSCLAQSYDMLSFNAMQVPTEDLDVNILIVG